MALTNRSMNACKRRLISDEINILMKTKTFWTNVELDDEYVYEIKWK